ncbi:hypothetical protein LTR55_011818 [Exophiala xenobiotica]|nr:hypothetical protein LTR55_011818 [Exophiala xenobiotica]
MGGQGKSQIALEYCRQAQQIYRGVFWIDSSSASTTVQSLVSIAQELDGSVVNALDDDDAKVRFALRTLERWDDRWLMVFDNCDDPATFSDVEQFVPQGGKGDILFTSRHRGLGELGTIIDIPPMPDKAGVELLLHRYSGISVSGYMSEESTIVNRLGGLALAIDQASAYMACKQLPIDRLSGFLGQYEAQRKKVLQHTADYFWKYMNIGEESGRQTAINAFTTWEMSFQQLLDGWHTPGSVAHLMTVAAFLAPVQVSECLFKFHRELSEPPPDWADIFVASGGSDDESSSSEADEDLDRPEHVTPDPSRTIHDATIRRSQETWDGERFWHLIRQAYQMSLLHSIVPPTPPGGATLILHPLIRDWLQLRVGSKDRQTYTYEAVDMIVSSLRTLANRDSDATIKRSILLHMDAALVTVKGFFRDGHRLGQDITSCQNADWFASFYRDQGRFNASLDLYRTVVATRARVQGKEHPDTLMSMNNLALVLRGQGKYDEAEQMHREVVEVQERVLGQEHPDTLRSMNNLALVLSDQGKHDEAEQMHREVVEVRERVLGKEHPSTLASMNNLATVLRDQGKYVEAEQMHREVVKVKERVLGQEYPDTLTSMNNLAEVLRGQGKYNEAEQMHRKVVEVQERVLGQEHPSTLTSMNNLAAVLSDQCQYEEAEKIQAVVVVGMLRNFGFEHPSFDMSEQVTWHMGIPWHGGERKGKVTSRTCRKWGEQDFLPALRTADNLNVCPTCSKSYKRPEHLRRHQISHRTERPYQCELCSSRFQRSDVLKRHLKTCDSIADSATSDPSDPSEPRPKRLELSNNNPARNIDASLPNSHGAGHELLAAADGHSQSVEYIGDDSFEHLSGWISCGLSGSQWEGPTDGWQAFLNLTSGTQTPHSGIDPGEPGKDIGSLSFLGTFTSTTGLVSSFDCGTIEQRRRVNTHIRNETAVPSLGCSSTNALSRGSSNTSGAFVDEATWCEINTESTVETTLSRWLSDPLSFKCHEIITYIRNIVLHKSKNSCVTLTWSPTVHETCAQFFSPSNIRRYTQLYWAIWHPNVNIVHKPTFDTVSSKPALLAAMCLMGACVSPERNDQENSKRWFNCVEEMVFEDDDFCDDAPAPVCRETGEAKRPLGKLRALQAAYIVCLYQNWEGSNSSKRRIRRHRFSTIIAVARDIGIHNARHPDYGRMDLYDFSFANFVMTEELIRVFLWVFLLDTAFVIFNNLPPRMVIREMKMSTACPEACFQAMTAEGCFNTIQRENRTNGLRSTVASDFSAAFELLYTTDIDDALSIAIANLGPLNLFAMTSALHSLIFHYQSSFSCQGSLYPIQNALKAWGKVWHVYATRSSLDPCHSTVTSDMDLLTPSDMWKRVGFVRHADEYCHLADLMVQRLSALLADGTETIINAAGQARSGSTVSGNIESISPLLDKYDETSMQQVNKLISDFVKVRIH